MPKFPVRVVSHYKLTRKTTIQVEAEDQDAAVQRVIQNEIPYPTEGWTETTVLVKEVAEHDPDAEGASE